MKRSENGRRRSGKRVNVGPGDKARNQKERHREVRKKRKRKGRVVGREKAKACSLRQEGERGKGRQKK